jgi:hypothetical protein
MDDRVNLAKKLAMFTEHWSPKIVGQLNDTTSRSSRSRESSCGTSTTRPTISSLSSRGTSTADEGMPRVVDDDRLWKRRSM